MWIATLETANGTLNSPVTADGTALAACALYIALPLAAQAAVAAGTARALPALPVALGAAGGVLAALGGAELLGALLHGPLPATSTLLWAGVGAAGIAMALRRKEIDNGPAAATRDVSTLRGATDADIIGGSRSAEFKVRCAERGVALALFAFVQGNLLVRSNHQQ
jgi:hypothetical protein